jgi:hypothetical protein
MFRIFGFFSGVLVATLSIGMLMDAQTRSQMLSTVMRVGEAATASVARRIGQEPDQADLSDDVRPATIATAISEARPIVAPVAVTAPRPPPEPAVASGTASAAIADIPDRPSFETPPQAPGAMPDQAPRPLSTTIPADGQAASVIEPGWQGVWKTFRSEVSAQGFADHLRHSYQAESRIRQVAPWQYRVEIAYDDNRQLSAILDAFRDDTGLDLAEATP